MHFDNVFFLLLLGVAALFKWLTQRAQTSEKEQDKANDEETKSIEPNESSRSGRIRGGAYPAFSRSAWAAHFIAATAKDNAAADGFPETRRAAVAFAAAHHSTACRRANASSGRDASAPVANPCTYSSPTHADGHFRFRSSPGAAFFFVARFGRGISIGKRPRFIAYSSDDPVGPGVA